MEAVPTFSIKTKLDEVPRLGGVAWATAGRTVENYIPIAALRTALAQPSLNEVPQFGDFFALTGQNKKRGKVRLAHKVTPHLTKEMLESTYDLKVRLTEVCCKIRKWNGQPEGADNGASPAGSAVGQ